MDEFIAAVDRIVDAFAALGDASVDQLSHSELLTELNRLKQISWALPSSEHRLLARLTAEATPQELGASSMRDVLAERLRISRTEANQRLKDAKALGPRQSISGAAVEPELSHTAAALGRGDIGPEHVRIIQTFAKNLPSWVDAHTRDRTERDLTRHASELRPEDLRKVAEQLTDLIDPDGAEPDYDLQQRKRSLNIGRQQRDGMRPINGLLDPETSALLDLMLAKWAAPGARLPDAGTPPSGDQTAGSDPRSVGQRNHDALHTALHQVVSSGELGNLNGATATMVITTSLSELESAAGYAHTGGGTRLPMRDVIRLAGQGAAHHYLAVFDDHTEEVLYLGRAKRCASTAQRLALFARDLGCTHPGCTAPFYRSQAHHAERDFAAGGNTNIDELTLACQPDNNLVEKTPWTTRRRDGRTEWLPPPELDSGQSRVNNYHHPQRYLSADEDGAHEDGDGPA